MMILLGMVLGLVIIWGLSQLMGFAGQKPENYAALTPAFDMRKHLDGDMLCEGMIYGPFGRVVSRFHARFTITWQGEIGRMVEDFKYDSGREQHREWALRVREDGSVEARADDVTGVGTGQVSGPCLSLKYRISLPKDAGGHWFDVTDWMYLVENGVIMNRSQFRRFGIKLAELVATIRPMAA